MNLLALAQTSDRAASQRSRAASWTGARAAAAGCLGCPVNREYPLSCDSAGAAPSVRTFSGSNLKSWQKQRQKSVAGRCWCCSGGVVSTPSSPSAETHLAADQSPGLDRSSSVGVSRVEGAGKGSRSSVDRASVPRAETERNCARACLATWGRRGFINWDDCAAMVPGLTRQPGSS